MHFVKYFEVKRVMINREAATFNFNSKSDISFVLLFHGNKCLGLKLVIVPILW